MVKITKVYTRNGDQGQTQLAYGHAIKKCEKRLCVIGDIDELNSHLGFVLAVMEPIESLQSLVIQCIRLQHELFNLGAQLAVLPQDRKSTTPTIDAAYVTALENEIDQMNESLETLRSFILPGGGEVAARFHLARSVCRRAERSLVTWAQTGEAIDEEVLPYINRLSDWLFVAARFAALQLKQPERLWQAGLS